MARKLRVEYPGAVYHVLNQGDRREAIFRDDTDRQRFLDTLAEACDKTCWQVHALRLMSNHFHLLVETPQPNLVAGMKWFRNLHRAVQPASQALRPAVQRAIQVAGGGRQRERLPEDRVRLRASEPLAGEVAEADAAVASVCLEQLARMPEGTVAAMAVAPGGAVAGGPWHCAGQWAELSPGRHTLEALSADTGQQATTWIEVRRL